jgi:FkbM family methyltransferase
VLFSVKTLSKIWLVNPTGVLHVGAHDAEELEDYEEFHWGDVIWVEAEPKKAAALAERLQNSSHSVLNGAAWNTSGEILILNIASNSQANSLLDLGTASESYPDLSYVEKTEIRTIRLDQELTNSAADFGNFDIQGAELRAMQGLGTQINNFKWIYTEVNKEYVYKGCALVSEIDEFLASASFTRVATRWVKGKGWGDALYIHQEHLPPKYKFLLGTFSNAFWRISPHAKYLTDQLRAARNRILFKQGKRIKISE